MTKDYGWKEAKTHAHSYLMPDIISAFKYLNIPKVAKILDAGCAGGYVMHVLYKSGFENIWGFDVSESGVKIAKEKFGEIQDRFEMHDAYERKLPNTFSERDYDTVISVEVIEHLYSPKTYLENINFWLKTNGFLILTTPYHGYLKNIAIALSNKFDNHVNPVWDGGHIKFFSKNTIYGLLKEVGFRPVKFYGSGRLPYLWKSMIVAAQKI